MKTHPSQVWVLSTPILRYFSAQLWEGASAGVNPLYPSWDLLRFEWRSNMGWVYDSFWPIFSGNGSPFSVSSCTFTIQCTSGARAQPLCQGRESYPGLVHRPRRFGPPWCPTLLSAHSCRLNDDSLMTERRLAAWHWWAESDQKGGSSHVGLADDTLVPGTLIPHGWCLSRC